MLQLIIMALLEIVLYTINEFIGRKILFAFDVGDTIFLHMFAAMFGHKNSPKINLQSIGPRPDGDPSDFKFKFLLFGFDFWGLGTWNWDSD